MQMNCLICENKQCEVTGGSIYGAPILNCSRCGEYALVGTAAGILPSMLASRRIDRSILSHLIRRGQSLSFIAKEQSVTQAVSIFETDLAGYKNASPLPKPYQQAEN